MIKSFLNVAEPRLVLKADVPNFTIVDYNDAYRHATYTRYRDIIGWYLWEVFDPARAQGTGHQLLLNTLTIAVERNDKTITEAFRYDIGSENPDKMMECWWQVEILPVMEKSGKPTYLLLKIIRLNV